MPDVDGNPDTSEVYEHFSKIKVESALMMDEARALERYADDFTPSAKALRVTAFKVAHPNCAICQSFNGNPPVS